MGSCFDHPNHSCFYVEQQEVLAAVVTGCLEFRPTQLMSWVVTMFAHSCGIIFVVSTLTTMRHTCIERGGMGPYLWEVDPLHENPLRCLLELNIVTV